MHYEILFYFPSEVGRTFCLNGFRIEHILSTAQKFKNLSLGRLLRLESDFWQFCASINRFSQMFCLYFGNLGIEAINRNMTFSTKLILIVLTK